MNLAISIINNLLGYSGAQVARYIEPRNTKFQDKLLLEEVTENYCESLGHRPSNVNPNECDCGMRRFDD